MWRKKFAILWLRMIFDKTNREHNLGIVFDNRFMFISVVAKRNYILRLHIERVRDGHGYVAETFVYTRFTIILVVDFGMWHFMIACKIRRNNLGSGCAVFCWRTILFFCLLFKVMVFL